MSSYENYSEVSKHYDKSRVPIGAEILIGALTLLRRSCSHIRLLDAGCGTGAYAELVLSYVDRIDAMDINPGMLAVAREKLADAASESRIAFHQDSVHKLPFAAECFDVVTFNQVLHHLETGQDGCFAGPEMPLPRPTACSVQAVSSSSIAPTMSSFTAAIGICT